MLTASTTLPEASKVYAKAPHAFDAIKAAAVAHVVEFHDVQPVAALVRGPHPVHGEPLERLNLR